MQIVNKLKSNKFYLEKKITKQLEKKLETNFCKFSEKRVIKENGTNVTHSL